VGGVGTHAVVATRAYEVLRTTENLNTYSQKPLLQLLFYNLDATLNGFLIVRGGLIPWFSEPANYKLAGWGASRAFSCFCIRSLVELPHTEAIVCKIRNLMI